jgi:hypothetical protein
MPLTRREEPSYHQSHYSLAEDETHSVACACADRADAFATQVWAAFTYPQTCRSFCAELLGWGGYLFWTAVKHMDA